MAKTKLAKKLLHQELMASDIGKGMKDDLFTDMYVNRFIMIGNNNLSSIDYTFERINKKDGSRVRVLMADYEDPMVLFGIIEYNFRRIALFSMIQTSIIALMNVKNAFQKPWSKKLIYVMALAHSKKLNESISDDEIPLFHEDFDDWQIQACSLCAKEIVNKLQADLRAKFLENLKSDSYLKKIIGFQGLPRRVIRSSQKMIYDRRAARLSQIGSEEASRIVSEINERKLIFNKEEDDLMECMVDPDRKAERSQIIGDSLVLFELMQSSKKGKSESKKTNKNKKQNSSKIVKTRMFDDVDEEEEECVICLDSVPQTRLEPCNHVILCEKCVVELQKKTNLCPMCRCPTTGWSIEP